MKMIVTHPGSAHRDDFLACCILVAKYWLPIQRREATEADLADPGILVVDTGGEYDQERGNFDHHQFPSDHPPICALSLVLKFLGVYEDARNFYEWLEPTEWFDSRGPHVTAEWLGVPRALLNRISSPIDVSLLRRFAQRRELRSGDVIWEMMLMIGEDLLLYLKSLRSRLDFIAEHAQFLKVTSGNKSLSVLYLPRTETMSDDPSSSVGRFIEQQGETVDGVIYPDRRGSGYGLGRYEDCARLDFTRISAEHDVHFAHVRGFVAKTSATDLERLLALVKKAWIDLE